MRPKRSFAQNLKVCLHREGRLKVLGPGGLQRAEPERGDGRDADAELVPRGLGLGDQGALDSVVGTLRAALAAHGQFALGALQQLAGDLRHRVGNNKLRQSCRQVCMRNSCLMGCFFLSWVHLCIYQSTLDGAEEQITLFRMYITKKRG